MTEAKKPFVVQTAVHARFLLAKAEARLLAQLAAAEETKVQISEYQNLADTLPDSPDALGRRGNRERMGLTAPAGGCRRADAPAW